MAPRQGWGHVCPSGGQANPCLDDEDGAVMRLCGSPVPRAKVPFLSSGAAWIPTHLALAILVRVPSPLELASDLLSSAGYQAVRV